MSPSKLSFYGNSIFGCVNCPLGGIFQQKTLILSIICISILLLHDGMVAGQANVFQVPAHIFRVPVYLHSGDSKNKLPSGQYRVVQRDLPPNEPSETNVKGYSGDGYYINMNIGTPGQMVKILIDTGSSNFAVASTPDPNLSEYFHIDRSLTFEKVGTEVYVPYTEGEWKGYLARDVVTLENALNKTAVVNIACITESKKFFISESQWQGILGLGYKGLSRPSASLTPYWDSFLETYPNSEDIFTMCLCGSSFVHNEKPLLHGSVTFGGIHHSLSKTLLLYTPIVRKLYYEVVLTEILVGGKPILLSCKELNFDKTIVDSGTTNIRLPTKVFHELVASIEVDVKAANLISPPEKSFYNGESILCFEDLAKPFFSFPVISFSLMATANASFNLLLTPQHYLRPVELNESQSCVKFGFSPSQTGTVLGAVFMEAFYVVFDRQASRIGFGQTTCPLPDPRHPVLNATLGEMMYTDSNNYDCMYVKSPPDQKSFLIASYIMIGLSVIIFIPLILFVSIWIRGRYKEHKDPEASERQNVLTE